VRADGRTVPGSAAQPGLVLEVIGHDVGHVYVSRRAADTIAPGGASILPAIVRLVMAHRACNQSRTEHRFADAVVCVVTAASAAVVVACPGEDVGAGA
jgi:hypothetical protein